MNFKKLSKEKRQHLIILVLATLLVADVLSYGVPGFPGLMRYQYQNHQRLQLAKKAAEAKRDQIQNALKRKEEIAAELAGSRKALADAEADVASGDLYSWVINTLRGFKAAYKVDVPSFQPIGPTTDVNLLPGFPYQQATLSVSGTAHYHDFGRFLADLENKFPHVRVVNLGLELNLSPTTEERETVTFRMDVVMLVKSNQS
jgi:Tfp pilus assembly protein PilO